VGERPTPAAPWQPRRYDADYSLGYEMSMAATQTYALEDLSVGLRVATPAERSPCTGEPGGRPRI